MKRKSMVTVPERVAELVAEHGSYRAAAEATGLALGHLHDMATGKDRARNTTPATANKLGLEVIYYRAKGG